MIIKGKKYQLAIINEDDASFMLQLRNDPDLTKYLPALKITIEQQRTWIAKTLNSNNEFNFKVINNKTQNIEGFLGIYNIQNNKAEWGRWILRKGSMAALESALLLHNFAFNQLKLSRVNSYTILENKNVISFHDKYGASRMEENENKIKLDDVYFNTIEHEVTPLLWNGIYNKYAFLIKNGNEI